MSKNKSVENTEQVQKHQVIQHSFKSRAQPEQISLDFPKQSVICSICFQLQFKKKTKPQFLKFPPLQFYDSFLWPEQTCNTEQWYTPTFSTLWDISLFLQNHSSVQVKHFLYLSLNANIHTCNYIHLLCWELPPWCVCANPVYVSCLFMSGAKKAEEEKILRNKRRQKQLSSVKCNISQWSWECVFFQAALPDRATRAPLNCFFYLVSKHVCQSSELWYKDELSGDTSLAFFPVSNQCKQTASGYRDDRTHLWRPSAGRRHIPSCFPPSH